MRVHILATLAALAVLAAPAAAAEPTVTVKGAPGAGPSRLDKVFVTKFGSPKARRVLVLVPGTSGGAGDFTLVARDLVKRERDIQVWAMDRRSQALEDTSVFREALAGRRTPKEALDFYLGWIADPSIQPHYQPLDEKRFSFVREWGLELALEDLRRVVAQARRGGRSVILGGHSLGASEAVAYASWDFEGRPGYRDIDGLVLIDGGLTGTFSTPNFAQTKARLAELQRSSPFLDLLGLGLPWAAGAFGEVGAIAALKDPSGPSIGQAFPLLPDAFKPQIPATNRGLLGFAFDETTSPKTLELIQVQAGMLGGDGDWRDGEVTPVRRLAELFGQEPANAIEWYFPRRLSIDVDGVQALERNAQTRLLGLRPFHRREVDVPLYAFQTSLTNGRVLRGARAFVKGSKVPGARYVDASATTSHLDPLTAAPERNDFLKTVRPFLRQLR